uniref:Uncharacterized protein n=1 Tax=Trichogramma kaykai TaxID=54128 RepID=A0ABD2WBR0_9HYME
MLLESLNVDIVASRSSPPPARRRRRLRLEKPRDDQRQSRRIYNKTRCRCSSARQSIRGACGHEIDTHIIPAPDYLAHAFLIITRELRDKNQSQRERERDGGRQK